MEITPLLAEPQDMQPELSHHESDSLRRRFAGVAGIALVAGSIGSSYFTEVASSTEDYQHQGAVAATTTHPSYRLTTYNVLGSGHAKSQNVPWRMSKIASFVSGHEGTSRTDIAGFQEVSPWQWDLLNSDLSPTGYTLYPSRPELRQNAMAVNTNRFIVLASGLVSYPFYGDEGLHRGGKAVWVRVEDKSTGQQLAVLNQQSVAFNHNPGSDRGGAQKRRLTAHIDQQWAAQEEAAHPSEIVATMGDYNSTNFLRNRWKKNWYGPATRVKDNVLRSRSGLPYCVLTEEPSILQNTEDMDPNMAHMYGHCPDKKHNGRPFFNNDKLKPNDKLTNINQIAIDAIYASPRTARATQWAMKVSALTRKISDHFPLTVRIEPR
jgi:hypothetical protein